MRISDVFTDKNFLLHLELASFVFQTCSEEQRLKIEDLIAQNSKIKAFVESMNDTIENLRIKTLQEYVGVVLVDGKSDMPLALANVNPKIEHEILFPDHSGVKYTYF